MATLTQRDLETAFKNSLNDNIVMPLVLIRAEFPDTDQLPSALSVNTTNETITFSSDHGILVSIVPIKFANGAPSGLTEGVEYWGYVISTTTIEVYTTPSLTTKANITGAGTSFDTYISGTVSVSTLTWNITWNNRYWLGKGPVLGISVIQDSTDGSANAVTLTLDGIASEVFNPIYLQNYQGRDAEIYFGCLDASTLVPLDNPVSVFKGKLDSDSCVDSGKEVSIALDVANQMVDQLKQRNPRYTHYDQQSLYSSHLDDGFEYMSKLQDLTIKWGTP